MGLKIGAATVEKSTEVPQKHYKDGTVLWPSNSSSGYLSEGNKTVFQEGTCTSLFIAALLIAKMVKQPHCPLINEWIKKVGCLYTMAYY